MSLVSFIGPRPNLFDVEGLAKKKRLEVRQPILTNEDLEKIRSISHVEKQFDTRTLDITYRAEQGAAGMKEALASLCEEAEEAVRNRYNIIILSDRQAGPDRIPMPALLATAAVHHHLIRKGLRTAVGLVVETGEAREVHHFCCLAGYGAEAINPYLAFETLVAMKDAMPEKIDEKDIIKRYIKSIDKGILKVMSKMGISTYQSYCGAQIFDAVGLRSDFVGDFFFGTATRIEGVGLDEIAEETARRHRDAFGDVPVLKHALDVGGEYLFRIRGEAHAWAPETVATLQHAVRGNSQDKYRAFAGIINEQSEKILTIRGMFSIKSAEEDGRAPVPLEEVEPAKEIVKRFATGAISYGSISREAHSTPGVGLISPPPHHDIYSIEDLAQLIYDLKNTNPSADVSVKLVSEVGVGTVAAGVSKARADHVTISGFEGGTGASPLTSLKHAGSPWEIGLAETHQTLVLNRLRSRIAVQVDGGLRTGRDVVIGAMLGADEFGFSTAPLIAAGCVMMRVCHLNTCPVGVATQDPVLRKRFVGQPEHVINYFFFVAEEGRELMAELGYRTFDEMVGQMQMLDKRKLIEHWKAKGLDFSRLFHKPPAPEGVAIYNCEPQNHHLERILDRTLIGQARAAIDRGAPVKIEAEIRNTDRTAGAMLSGEIAKVYGHTGLPDDTIHVKLKGTAGQSFGAWLARGVTFELEGEANDYVGKGLSGGRIVARPAADAGIVPEESIIVGNTVLYGAIEGECYFRGVAGERFAVRNSGAVAVIEGAGDHCCEYMTGGIVVVIGRTGRNFAAGMSGGLAYVLDQDGTFASRCNLAMVELEPVLEEENASWAHYHQAGDLDHHGRVDVMSDMSRFDAERLHQLISNHARYTGSRRAKDILAAWNDYLPKFRKVMPVEYRSAIAELKATEVTIPPMAAAGA